MIEFLGWTVLVLISIYAYFWVGFFICNLIPYSEDSPITFAEACRKELGNYWIVVIWPISVTFCFLLDTIPWLFKSCFASAEKSSNLIRNLFSTPPKKDEKPTDENQLQ